MSFLAKPYYAPDFNALVDETTVDSPTKKGLRIAFHTGTDSAWGGHVRQAFEFLRQHSSRRYSNNSLMRVLDLADYDFEDRPAPYIFRAEVPYEFDPISEVKTGGALGVMVQLNDGSSRALLAVAPSHRRLGVATALLQAHLLTLGTPSMWVSSSNVVGQMFLLSQGLMPQDFNARGVLRYGAENVDD
ncbi:MAG: hypothetical protein WC822_05895 [Candidatus Paceibacterota bacterium]|jgi:GNAT superfamily N-acetyltransferase